MLYDDGSDQSNSPAERAKPSKFATPLTTEQLNMLSCDGMPAWYDAAPARSDRRRKGGFAAGRAERGMPAGQPADEARGAPSPIFTCFAPSCAPAVDTDAPSAAAASSAMGKAVRPLSSEYIARSFRGPTARIG